MILKLYIAWFTTVLLHELKKNFQKEEDEEEEEIMNIVLVAVQLVSSNYL